MLSDTELAVALILSAVIIVAFVALYFQAKRYKRDQEVRAMVAGWIAEYRESRKHLVECKHCLHGMTLRPEVLAGTYSFESDEPMLTECEVCDGEGMVPREQLS